MKILLSLLLFTASAYAQWFNGITTSPTSNSCVIAFNTAAPTVAHVKYGTTSSYGNNTAWSTSYSISHSVTISGLSPSTIYHFRVVGKDTEPITVTSLDHLCTTLSVTGSHTVALTWNASTTAGVTYSVYRSLTSGSGYSTQASALSTLTYNDTAVSSGTTYFYVVTAFNGQESAYSNEAQAVIPSP